MAQLSALVCNPSCLSGRLDLEYTHKTMWFAFDEQEDHHHHGCSGAPGQSWRTLFREKDLSNCGDDHDVDFDIGLLIQGGMGSPWISGGVDRDTKTILPFILYSH